MEFVKGQFVTYRATVKFHIGVEGKDIQQDSTVEFDGWTLRAWGKEIEVMALRGAIASRNPLLVPVADTTSTYRPMPAEFFDRQNNAIRSKTLIEDDERVVGQIRSARPNQSGTQPPSQIRTATVSGEDRVVGQIPSAKVFAVEMLEDQEAIPVARIKVPTKQAVVINDPSVVSREISRLEAVNGPPHRTSEPIPRAVTAIDEIVNEVGQSVTTAVVQLGTPDEGHDNTHPVVLPLVEVLRPDAAAIAEAQVAAVRAVLPDFAWDIARPWRTRVRDALALAKTKPQHLAAIRVIETDAVRKHISEALAEGKA